MEQDAGSETYRVRFNRPGAFGGLVTVTRGLPWGTAGRPSGVITTYDIAPLLRAFRAWRLAAPVSAPIEVVDRSNEPVAPEMVHWITALVCREQEALVVVTPGLSPRIAG